MSCEWKLLNSQTKFMLHHLSLGSRIKYKQYEILILILISKVKTFDPWIISSWRHTLRWLSLWCTSAFLSCALFPYEIIFLCHKWEISSPRFQIHPAVLFVHQDPQELFKSGGFLPRWQPYNEHMIVINNTIQGNHDKIMFKTFSPISPNLSLSSLIRELYAAIVSLSSILIESNLLFRNSNRLVFFISYNSLRVV